jgi:hypothetical protein
MIKGERKKDEAGRDGGDRWDETMGGLTEV